MRLDKRRLSTSQLHLLNLYIDVVNAEQVLDSFVMCCPSEFIDEHAGVIEAISGYLTGIEPLVTGLRAGYDSFCQSHSNVDMTTLPKGRSGSAS